MSDGGMSDGPTRACKPCRGTGSVPAVEVGRHDSLNHRQNGWWINKVRNEDIAQSRQRRTYDCPECKGCGWVLKADYCSCGKRYQDPTHDTVACMTKAVQDV